jgi:hypothetical protein
MSSQSCQGAAERGWPALKYASTLDGEEAGRVLERGIPDASRAEYLGH